MVLGYWRIRKVLPSALKTSPARNHEEARQRTLWLYRTCLRQAAEIQQIYPLDVPIPHIRARMRQEFEKNRYVAQLDSINTLLMKGQMELEETLYMWKTQATVMNYFREPYEIKAERKKASNWLADFYSQ